MFHSFLIPLLPSLFQAKCQIKFTFYNGEEIPEDRYESNYLGFRVVSSKECERVKVIKDGIEIEERGGYNEVGEYRIESSGVEKKIVLRGVEESEKIETHITFHKASFSVIQSIQQLIKIQTSEKKADQLFLYYEREGTLVKNEVIKNLNATSAIPGKLYTKEMKDKIWEMYMKNPNLYIVFYCEDIRCDYITMFFINQGIPIDRYFVNLNSDGMGTYGLFYEKDDDGKWVAGREEFESILSKANVGNLPPVEDMEYCYLAYFFATLPNVRLIPSTMEYLQSNHTEVKKTLGAMNVETVDPVRDLRKMGEAEQRMYFGMTGVDAEYWRTTYFPKKPLIIIGTSSRNEGHYFSSAEEFRVFLMGLMSFYGPEYSVCFKPHPSSSGGPLFRRMLAACGVKTINTQVPTEAVMSALGDVKVGGYFSTVFLSGTPEFIFAKNVSEVPGFFWKKAADTGCKFVYTKNDLRSKFGSTLVGPMIMEITIAAVVPTFVLGAVCIALSVWLCRVNKSIKRPEEITQPLVDVSQKQ